MLVRLGAVLLGLVVVDRFELPIGMEDAKQEQKLY